MSDDWRPAKCPYCGGETNVNIADQPESPNWGSDRSAQCDHCEKMFRYSIRIEIDTREVQQ